MPLPPLYKYLSVQGSKLTLGTRTFKHAKPSDFNDVEDLTISSIFPEETEAALTRLSGGFTDVILQHLNDIPTCGSPMKEQLAVIQRMYRENPGAVDVIKAEQAKRGLLAPYDVEHMRARSKEFVAVINEFLQSYRVLCVSTHRDSEEMWAGYAEGHKGIMLRIEPNIAKDSEFKLFKPVDYCERRPPLYPDTLQFIADSLFGDPEARVKAILERIIYTKTLKWKHEGEYRLSIPVGKNQLPWDTLPYHAEEITELHLGVAMEAGDRDEIIGLAKAVNPNIIVFRALRDADGKLRFERD
jgi:hypothetical protein